MGVVFERCKSVLKSSPLLFRPSCYAQYHAIRLLAASQRTKTRVMAEAPIEPFRLYRIDPHDVDVILAETFDTPRFDVQSPVIGGDWDRRTRPLLEYDLFRAVYQHFTNDVPWEETDFYARVRAEISETDAWFKWGCTDFEEFRARLSDLDALYERIDEQGYRRQCELQSSETDPIGTRSCYPPQWHEVTVHVGRDGRYILQEGRHRLAITQALDLPTIPVRIMARHRKWQRFRTRVYRGAGSVRPEIHAEHPDIVSLVE